MCIYLTDASDRNTDSKQLTIGAYRFLFSYDTCVAVKHIDGNFERENTWGRATGRHLNEFRGFPFTKVTEKEMKALLQKAVVETSMGLTRAKFRRT